jgi:hypothetical protein
MRAITVVRAALGLGSVVILSACATIRNAPAVPPHVTFASGRDFVVQQLSDPTVRCFVRSAEVQLGAIRNDTVFFTALASHSRASITSPRCALDGPGLIDLAAYPRVQAEMPRRSAAREAIGFLGVLGAVLGGWILYSLVRYGGLGDA